MTEGDGRRGRIRDLSVASGHGETGVTFGPVLCQLLDLGEAFGLSGPQFIYLWSGGKSGTYCVVLG